MGKMKFLVFGAMGMAGHTISVYLIEQGHNVTTFSRTPFRIGQNVLGDATDSAFVKKLLQENQFDFVVNCIGLLNQECDKDPAKAVLLNSYLPHYLADILKNGNGKLIHISTDCVFSGKIGHYSEHDLRDGETFYDRTKALGEIEDNRNLTFRNSIIGPDMKGNGIGLFNWFMKQTGPINGYSKAMWNGVSTLVLAKAIEQAAKVNLAGLYHLVNCHSISKFDLLMLFNKHMRDNNVEILNFEKISIDKSLVNNREDFHFHVPTYEQMIIEMKKWIIDHHDLYPHYFF
jgi:dTDP-4-dehydrorhamnose reductase